MAAEGEINAENLLPTERVAVEHNLPVHQQTVVSQTLNDVRPDLLHWDWKQDGSCFTPIQTDNDVAPAEVMKVIRCSTTCATVCSVHVRDTVWNVSQLVDNAEEKFVNILR